MKRVLLISLFLSLVFGLACKTRSVVAPPSPIPPSRAEKRVVIAISDDIYGGYKVEGPLPDSVYLRPGHQVRWSIINNTKGAVVSSVTIDGFHTKDNTYKNPFEGDSSDQEFKYNDVNLQPSQEDSLKLSKVARAVSAGEVRVFKYKVTIRISGLAYPIIVDPQVVIGE
jgi:hypothetical protein